MPRMLICSLCQNLFHVGRLTEMSFLGESNNVRNRLII